MAFTFGYTNYTTSQATPEIFNVKLRSDVAAALGLTLTQFPTTALWPYGRKNMREIRAKGQTRGNSIRVTIPDPGNALFNTLYSTFVWTDGQTYTITEIKGEKIPTRI